MPEPTFKKKQFGISKEKQQKETKTATVKSTEVEAKSSKANIDGKAKLSAFISISNHRKVRMAAADQYISMTQVVEELIDRNL